MTVESNKEMTKARKDAERQEILTNGPEGGRGAHEGSAAPPAGLTPTRVLVALGAAGPVLFLAFGRLLPPRSPAARALLGLTGILIAISGAGLVISGVFPTDPSGGPRTDTGAIHDLAFLVVLLPLILAYPAAALAMRKVPGWGRHALATALVPVAVFGLMFVFVAFAGDPGDPLHAVGGLLQRALLAVAFGWITLTGWRLLRRTSEGDQHAGSPVR